jgi:VanZ family protein
LRRIAVWTPSLVVMAVIFVLSSLPDPGTAPGGVSDKILHLLVYAILGASLLFALADARPDRVTVGAAILALCLGTVYGISDEWHQSMVPHRSVEVLDLAADAAGSAIGVAGASALARWITRRRSPAR